MTEIYMQLSAALVLVACLLVIPLIFILLDLWAGVRKAQQRGDKIRSNKMKRTVNKISKYYNAVLALCVVDAVQIAAFCFMARFYDWTPYTIPIFTIIGVLFVAGVEIKSIIEPANEKESRERDDIMALAVALAGCEKDPKKIAQAVADFFSASTDKKDEFNS